MINKKFLAAPIIAIGLIAAGVWLGPAAYQWFKHEQKCESLEVEGLAIVDRDIEQVNERLSLQGKWRQAKTFLDFQAIKQELKIWGEARAAHVAAKHEWSQHYDAMCGLDRYQKWSEQEPVKAKFKHLQSLYDTPLH